MIGDNFSKSILGLAFLFIVATLIGWGATRFDDYLVDNLKMKSSSIIIIESIVLGFFVLIYIFYNKKDRDHLISDIEKIGVKEWSGFVILSLAGVYISLLLNRSLKHWETSEFRMTKEIITLLLGGILFFSFTKEEFGYKKVITYFILAGAAIFFNMI